MAERISSRWPPNHHDKVYPKKNEPSDFATEVDKDHHGDLIVLRALSDRARAWIKENMPANCNFSGAIIGQPDSIADIVEQIQADGLSVE